MYDIKPLVNQKLSEIVGDDKVSDEFNPDYENLPYITFYELLNTDPYKLKEELYTEIVIQVDIWHNRSTGSLARQVNEAMNSIGLKREFARDISEPSGIKRKTMRFRGVINNKTLIMYQ